MRSVLETAIGMARLPEQQDVKPQNRDSKPASDPPLPRRHDARHPRNGRFVSVRDGKVVRG